MRTRERRVPWDFFVPSVLSGQNQSFQKWSKSLTAELQVEFRSCSAWQTSTEQTVVVLSWPVSRLFDAVRSVLRCWNSREIIWDRWEKQGSKRMTKEDKRRERYFWKIKPSKKCMGIVNVNNGEYRRHWGGRRIEKKSMLISVWDLSDGVDWMSSNWDYIMELMTVLYVVECLFVFDVMQSQRVNVYCSISWMENV